MAQNPARAAAPSDRTKPARPAGKPFFGLIDAVIVESPVPYMFDGAIPRDDAAAVWLWLVRDIAPDLIDIEVADDEPRNRAAVESLLPELLGRAKKAIGDGAATMKSTRRIKSQLGGDEAWERLPLVLNALRCSGLLDKAQGFGRAANGISDDSALALAFQSMPLNDLTVAPFLMQAAVSQMATPSRLIMAAIRIAGGASDTVLLRTGFGPLIDALLAHAQNQIPILNQPGTFGDIDLLCRAVDRFHRLMRAVTGYVELARTSRWATAAAGLTTMVSERLEPRLRDVAPDLNKAMRKRDGADRLDGDQILSALNGMYLLAAVRDARDSLAVNHLFDQVWTQTGQALEIHIERLLQALRDHPTDKIASARLDAALKMAELRFTQEYADTLRRAKGSAERRLN